MAQPPDTTTRHRALLWPALRARPRLLAAMAVGLTVWLLSAALPLNGPTRTLLAWNAGALLYLGLAWHLMRDVPVEEIRRRSPGQSEGRLTILGLVVAAAAAVLLAVGSQVALAKTLDGSARALHLALAGLTVVTSWLFTHVLFALHYAHDFWLARHLGQPDPLDFPGTPDPGYADFVHFACVIGTSGQTADISFQGPALRPVGTLHCVLAFFFNAALLGLAINVLAGLL